MNPVPDLQLQADAGRLDATTLASLPAQVRRPAYDRAATRIGVVHFGPGAKFEKLRVRDAAIRVAADNHPAATTASRSRPRNGNGCA